MWPEPGTRAVASRAPCWRSVSGTTRICQDNGYQPRSFTATFGIAIDDLRGWCAEHHGCSKEEIALWFDE
jgi:hypothetical protein